MAKHITVSFMITLLMYTLIQDAMSLEIHSTEGNGQKHYWHGFELPPEPYEGFYAEAQHCIEVLTDKCGEQMLEFIIYLRSDLSKKCCHRLHKMGGECNKKLSSTLSQFKEYSKWAEYIYDRSVEAFKCPKK